MSGLGHQDKLLHILAEFCRKFPTTARASVVSWRLPLNFTVPWDMGHWRLAPRRMGPLTSRSKMALPRRFSSALSSTGTTTTLVVVIGGHGHGGWLRRWAKRVRGPAFIQPTGADDAVTPAKYSTSVSHEGTKPTSGRFGNVVLRAFPVSAQTIGVATDIRLNWTSWHSYANIMMGKSPKQCSAIIRIQQSSILDGLLEQMRRSSLHRSKASNPNCQDATANSHGKQVQAGHYRHHAMSSILKQL
jgi:hypothetical protein